MTKRFSLFRTHLYLAALCLCAGGSAAIAQERYPSKPVQLIVPFGAGGGQDVFARIMQPLMEKALGQRVIVVNKPGAGGGIGFTEVAKAAPDGHVIGQATPSLIVLRYTVAEMNVVHTNYEPIMFGGYVPYGVAVSKDARWNTWREFRDEARANPSKMRIGNAGFGGGNHIACISLEKATGTVFTHVSYKGIAPSFQEVIGGHIDAVCVGVTDALQLVKGNKLKFLAVTAPERSKVIADVPTFKELGSDVEFTTFYGWVGPKGMPRDRVSTMHNALKAAIDSTELREFADTQGITIAPKGPEDFRKFLAQEDLRWKEAISAGGIKPQ